MHESNDATSGRLSRGYLRAWLGATIGFLAGGIPGVLLLLAMRDEGFVVGFVFGWIPLLLTLVGSTAGAIGGTYLFLRHGRLQAAGRTAWLVLPVCIAERVLDAIIGRSLVGTPIGGVWITILWIATLAAPLIARRLALAQLRTVG